MLIPLNLELPFIPPLPPAEFRHCETRSPLDDVPPKVLPHRTIPALPPPFAGNGQYRRFSGQSLGRRLGNAPATAVSSAALSDRT